MEHVIQLAVNDGKLGTLKHSSKQKCRIMDIFSYIIILTNSRVWEYIFDAYRVHHVYALHNIQDYEKDMAIYKS